MHHSEVRSLGWVKHVTDLPAAADVCSNVLLAGVYTAAQILVHLCASLM